MSEAVLHQWLEAQCARIPGVRAGLLHLTTKAGKRSIVQWPTRAPRLAQLVKAAQLSIAHRRLIAHKDLEDRQHRDTARIIALPVALDSDPTLSIALSYTSNDPAFSRKIIEALQQSIDSLTALFEQAPSDPQTDNALEILTRLLATALSQDSIKSLATTLTTEVATQLHCDRVALGYRDGKQSALIGLSNSAEHKPRQALVEALEAAMDEAIDQHATVEFPPPAEQRAQIHLLHRQLAERHNGGAICTVPLFAGGEAVGALLLERPTERIFSHRDVELCENFASFLAPVLKMQHDINQGWFKRNWRALKQLTGKLFSKGDLLYKVVPLTILSLAAGASIVTVPFELNAPARIEGAIQRIISAPADGYIETVHVRPGDRVSKGQVLIELEDDTLKLERRKLEGEIAQLRSAYGAALASRDRAELSVVQAQIEEAKARLALIKQRLDKVRLVAPFDALVIDGDLTQALGAPVNEGDKLLTLAPQNDFRVIVDINERDIRFVEPGQHGKLTLTASPQDQFDIDIRQITPMAQISNGANIFPSEAAIVDGPTNLLRPGMEGVSRIGVGERSLLWTTMRRSIDWLQFRLWIWLG